MKRTKQLLSLFLALALVMSFAAVPVLAAGDTADAEEKESIPEGNQTEGMAMDRQISQRKIVLGRISMHYVAHFLLEQR